MGENWEAFACGVIGAVSVELIRIFSAIKSGRPPKRLTSILFWIVWILVAILAGVVAGFIYCLPNRVASFQIGLSLPLLIESGAKGSIASAD